MSHEIEIEMLIWCYQGKAKNKAWQAIVDEGLTSDEAKEKYVALVEKMKEKYGYDANKAPEAVGGGS
jgi:diazepam-binding inhibitor (GABA receptor modulating acyl-CoA-binding protein)